MAVEREGPARAVEGEAPARAADEGRIEALEARVRELDQTVARMDARLRQLEGLPLSISAAELEPALVSGVRERPPPAAGAAEERPAPLPGPTLGEVLPQIAGIGGRTLLILGGGYLIRDLTERGVFAPSLGALLGIVYGALWLLVAFRAAPSASAAFYGASYALTVFPLLGEITVRFELLSPLGSAVAYGVAAAAGAAVAWQRRLAVTAWAVLGLAVITSAGALLQTRAPLPYLALYVGLGVGFDFCATSRGWAGMRQAAALVPDVSLLVFAVLRLMGEEYSFSATLLQLGLFGAYMLFFAVRAQLEKRSLTPFERVQATAVLVIGYLGAVWVAHRTPSAPVLALGAISLAVGAVAYAVAYFLFVVPGRNPVEAWFNTSYALVGVLVGSWLVLPEPGFAWAGIGALFALLGTRDRHAALPLHAAVCAFFAALGSGLLGLVWDAFWARPEAGIGAIEAAHFVCLGVALLAFLSPLESARARALWSSQVARVLALSVAVAGLGGVVVTLLSGPIGGGFGAGADAGRMAALRTAILAASALGLALASRSERLREASFLVYPVLGVGAVKLLAQDFPNGRALTLFVGFMLFGVASIFAPRLRFHAGRGDITSLDNQRRQL